MKTIPYQRFVSVLADADHSDGVRHLGIENFLGRGWGEHREDIGNGFVVLGSDVIVGLQQSLEWH